MSETVMYAFDQEGNCGNPATFRNSHFHGPVIWSYMWTKYCCTDPMSLDHAFGFFSDPARLWKLQYDPRPTDDEWYAFMCTMDNTVVPPELVDTVCTSFLSFGQRLPRDRLNHSVDYVVAMRKMQKEVKGLRGICWWPTSVIDDPWSLIELPETRCPDCDDVEPGVLVADEVDSDCPKCGGFLFRSFRAYNLDLDEKHQFMPRREDHVEADQSLEGGIAPTDVVVDQGLPNESRDR